MKTSRKLQIRIVRRLWLACFGLFSLLASQGQGQEPPARPQRIENRAEITVPAVFKFYQEGRWRYLILSNEQHNYMIPWPLDPRFNGASVVQSNQVYTFTVVEEPCTTITVPVTNTTAPQVVRIRKDSQVIYDLEQCEIHHTTMERLEVPISYGLRPASTNEPSFLTEQRLFPHHREEVDGGCIILSTSPKTKDVYVCRQCQAAYENWKKEHGQAQR